MTELTLAGWVVAHSLWQGTFIAGLAALALGLLRNGRPGARARVAAVALAAVTIAPILTALAKPDLMPRAARRPVMMTIDQAMSMPAYLDWRSAAMPIVGALWLAGVVMFLVRLGVAWRGASALRSGNTGAADAVVRAETAALSAQLAISPAVDVRRSSSAHVPMVLGSRRPVILLPDVALAVLSPEQRRSILAHELAHVGRRDYLANLWQLVADCLTYFHPAARWLSRRIRIEREYCCDDVAIGVAGDRAVYARALAALDDARSDCALAVAAVSGTLVDRIERIAGRPRRLIGTARGLALLIAATLIAAAIAATTLVLPQDIPPGTRMRSRQPAPGALTAPPGGAQLPKERSPRS